MLNTSFLVCTKVELLDLIVCIVVTGDLLKANNDLDLYLTKLNIELVRAIFIYYYIIQFRTYLHLRLINKIFYVVTVE